MIRLAEKFSPTVLRLENADFVFDPQLGVIDIRFGRDKTNQALGLTGIEIIHDKVPAADGRVGGDGGLNMGEKVLFGPGRATRHLPNLPGHHCGFAGGVGGRPKDRGDCGRRCWPVQPGFGTPDRCQRPVRCWPIFSLTTDLA